MTSDLFPLGNAVAADLREIKQAGLLLPLRKSDQTILVTEWDNTMHGVMLTGAHDFIFFPIKLDYPQTGLFVPLPDIVIDFSTVEKSIGYEHRNGDLLLEQDKLSIIATRTGDHFHDPQPVPLWTHVAGGSQAVNAVFTRWAIGVRSGDQFQTLWERKAVAKSTVAFSEDA